MGTIVAPEFTWHASTDEGDRHAFPQREDQGLPPPALCGLRWTAAYGKGGSRYCDSCLGTLRRILSGASEALTEAEYLNATGDLEGLIAADNAAGAGESVEAFRG
jgi:hypothetical protein